MLTPIVLFAGQAVLFQFVVPTPTATATPIAIQTGTAAHAAPALAGAPGKPPAVSAASSPAAAPTAPVSAAPKTLSDLARERKLAKEPKTGMMSISGSSGGTTYSASAAGKVATSAAAAASEEAKWVERATNLRERLEAARSTLTRMENEIPIVYLRNGEISASAWASRQAALAPYRLKVEDLESEMARLPEECRKAGCSPGWIR